MHSSEWGWAEHIHCFLPQRLAEDFQQPQQGKGFFSESREEMHPWDTVWHILSGFQAGFVHCEMLEKGNHF